jgi:branched-chain amino acid aminotransferase group I
MKVTVIHCWSAPRSRSTALLYSFNARSDCEVLDEPLYRRWLEHNKDYVVRPYTSELINGIPPVQSTPDERLNWEKEKPDLNTRILLCLENLKSENRENGVIFIKHMAKHSLLYNFEIECEMGASPFSAIDEKVEIQHKHVLLIRDPVSMLSSWNASADIHNGNVTPNEIGIVYLLSIYSNVESKCDATSSICVIESDDLAMDPEKTLSALCNDLDIPSTTEMLSWNIGPKACDGPWASWWYINVHKSSGWSSKCVRKYQTLDPKLLPVLRVSLGAFNFLKQLTHRYKLRGPAPSEIYEDSRNENILAYIGAPGYGRLVPRDMASISPWDSSVQGGDAAWEGIRVYRGKILSLERHLKRLFKSAKALGFRNVHSKEEVIEAIFRTLAANGMRDGAHMRLTLTRGEKCTSSMNPNFNVYGTTLIVLAEWKPSEGKTTYDNVKGISLITSAIRRNSPSTCDSKIHHNNMINNILPKIQANLAGAADALMLDLNGFVSETNATNIFMVEDGVLLTPHGDHCLPGITRGTILLLAKEIGIETEVRNISLSEFHSADEVFTTGTMGELTPVTTIDGRKIGNGLKGPFTIRLQEIYSTLPEREGWATPIPPFLNFPGKTSA